MVLLLRKNKPCLNLLMPLDRFPYVTDLQKIKMKRKAASPSAPPAFGISRYPASLPVLTAVGTEPLPVTGTVVVKIPFTVVIAGTVVCWLKIVEVDQSSLHLPPLLSRQRVVVGVDLAVDE